MRPYSESSKCRKCGCDKVGTTFVPRSWATDERIERWCTRCRHKWDEAPLDSVPSPKPQEES